MRIVLAWPLAAPRILSPRRTRRRCAGEMKTPVVDASGDENLPVPAEYVVRMRRAPGGRSRVIYVRVTEDEDGEIRRRAIMHRRSAQRFLIETALSGSA